MVNVGEYTSPMDPMGMDNWGYNLKLTCFPIPFYFVSGSGVQFGSTPYPIVEK